jgi:hypothetical protein
MGGTSSSSSTQQSSTSPWATGTAPIQGIVSQLNPLIGQSGLNPIESGAISQITNMAGAGNPYASQIGANATSLLNGGGALNQAAPLNQAFQTYQSQLTPYTSPNYSTLNSPAVQAALQQNASDITNQVNGEFAAAGREGSGMNQQTLARGIEQANAPVILNQANTDTATGLGAGAALNNAAAQNAGLLAGLQQQYLANTQTGTQAATDAWNAQLLPYQTQLAAQQQGQTIPAQNLGMLAQIGIPIAGLGTNSTGSSSGTSTESGAQQFSQIAGGIGSLLGSGGLFGSGTSIGSPIAGSVGPTSLNGAPLKGTNGGGLFGSLFG